MGPGNVRLQHIPGGAAGPGTPLRTTAVGQTPRRRVGGSNSPPQVVPSGGLGSPHQHRVQGQSSQVCVCPAGGKLASVSHALRRRPACLGGTRAGEAGPSIQQASIA